MKKQPKINLRDYFAGLAMHATLLRPDLKGDTDEDTALNSYEYADAMMEVRSRGQKHKKRKNGSKGN